MLKKPWSVDSTLILLKKWIPLFNAQKERVDIGYYPHLGPVVGASHGVLVGKEFLGAREFLGEFFRSIYVIQGNRGNGSSKNYGISEYQGRFVGLFGVSNGRKIVEKTLDYEGDPFICRRCHQYGHNVKICHLPFHGSSGQSSGTSEKKRGTPLQEVSYGPYRSRKVAPNSDSLQGLVGGPDQRDFL